ncbi:MAG: hypothetical protein ACI8Z9_001980 [Paraglaciecola sp.]|jgi:hypothetical protein
MASLHAFTPAQEQATFLKVSVHQQHRLHGFVQGKTQNKWMYLVSDTIAFQNKQQRAFRLSKPDDATLVQYLEKIITGGQCATLFVEKMHLDEMNTQRLKQLATLHQVSIVNLVVSEIKSGELLKGPW